MFGRLMDSLERWTYGSGGLIGEAQATRALLKFCVDHGCTHPAMADIRACLAALEVGERSKAAAAFGRIPMGKEMFNDWWPPAVAPQETEEYAWMVFMALVERWSRLMTRLAEGRP